MTQEINLTGDSEFSVGDKVRFQALFTNEMTGEVVRIDSESNEIVIKPNPKSPFCHAKHPSEVEHV